MNAPIQSPSRQDSMSSQSSASTQQSPMNQMAPPPQQQQQQQQPPPAMQTPSTDAFLRDFTLVAEAAKRAQMAVMMRDFEACGLS